MTNHPYICGTTRNKIFCSYIYGEQGDNECDGWEKAKVKASSCKITDMLLLNGQKEHTSKVLKNRCRQKYFPHNYVVILSKLWIKYQNPVLKQDIYIFIYKDYLTFSLIVCINTCLKCWPSFLFIKGGGAWGGRVTWKKILAINLKENGRQ